MDRVQKLGVTASMTIGHVYYWGFAFDKENILGRTGWFDLDQHKNVNKGIEGARQANGGVG